MLKLAAIVLALLLTTPAPVYAIGKVVGPGCAFEWDANTETDLEGYRLYLAQVPGGYTAPPVDVGNVTTFTCADAGVELREGQWFVVATAYDLAGNESGYSNEVPFVFDATAPVSPGTIRINKK